MILLFLISCMKNLPIQYKVGDEDEFVYEIDKDGNTALHKAVLENDSIKLMDLIKLGLDINSTNDLEETPLNMAINLLDPNDGRYEIDLEDKRYEKAYILRYDESALIYRKPGVLRYVEDNILKKMELIRILIRNAANINQFNDIRDRLLYSIDEDTPLLKAIYLCYKEREELRVAGMELVKYLIEYKADVNKSKGKYTPLVTAVDGYLNSRNNNLSLDLIKLLIKNGACIDIIDEYGDNYIMCLIIHSVSYLERYDLNKIRRLMNILIHNRFDINHSNHKGESIMIKLVKERIGVFLNHETTEVEEIRSSPYELFKLLFSKGGDIDKADDNGDTPLIILINSIIDFAGYIEREVCNRVEIIEFLIKNGVDINKANKFGDTPLIQSIKSGDVKTIFMLLEANVDITKVNSQGQNVLCLFQEGKTGIDENKRYRLNEEDNYEVSGLCLKGIIYRDLLLTPEEKIEIRNTRDIRLEESARPKRSLRSKRSFSD